MHQQGMESNRRVVVLSQTLSGPERIASRELLGGSDRLIIAHGKDEYPLRLTRNGKLILTK